MPQIEWLLSLHALISGTGFSKLPGETHPLWTLQRPVQQKTPRVGSGFSIAGRNVNIMVWVENRKL